MTHKQYKKDCPTSDLTYQQWLRSIQIMFKRRFGFYPRDQQISACGCYPVFHDGNKYYHGSVAVGDWVYEYEFYPITTSLSVPSYGVIPMVDNVYDWVLEQIWHNN